MKNEEAASFAILHSNFEILSYRPAARRFPPPPITVTAAAPLFTLPHGLFTRTQNCAGAVIGGATSGGVMSCAALPLAAGWEVSPRGPSYQTIVSGREPVMPV